MKIISGYFKNKTLYLPKKNNINIKPVGLRIKESIYDLIQFSIYNKKILDLFAGSGQLGIEAISRGAKYVMFVDHLYESIKLIKKNVNFIQSKFLYDIKMVDYYKFLNENNDSFDIIFLDPPYNKDIINKVLTILSKINVLNHTGMIICKHHVKEKIILPYSFYNIKEKEYGNNKITIVSRKYNQ